MFNLNKSVALIGLLLAIGAVCLTSRKKALQSQVHNNLQVRRIQNRLPKNSRVSVPAHEGSLQFIGTATLLIRYGDFTILVDPNFIPKGEKVHLGYGIRSTRLTNPAFPIEDLPEIDLSILSHYHADHFDQLVKKKLPRNFPIVTTPPAAQTLRNLGFKQSVGIQSWQVIIFEKGNTRLRITAIPGLHACGLFSEFLPPVMGSMLEFSDAQQQLAPYRIYLSGDTMPHESLKEIPKEFPEIDVAILHLGGTRIMGRTVTMNAEHGVNLMQLLNPKVTIPVHYNDYTVFKSPLQDFKDAITEAGLNKKVHYLYHGDEYKLSC